MPSDHQQRYHDPDPSVALTLQRQEVLDMLAQMKTRCACRKGKRKRVSDDDSNIELCDHADFHCALILQNQYFDDVAVCIDDPTYEAIAEVIELNGRERQDRELALRMAAEGADNGNNNHIYGTQPQEGQLLQQEAEWAHEKRNCRRMQCSGCFEDLRRAHMAMDALPCGHAYCIDCLSKLCAAALQDDDLLPVRCCRHPIPMEAVKSVLTPSRMELYERALEEHATHDRIYCGNERCGIFMGARGQSEKKPQICPS
eukprot:gene5804-6999_t